MLEPIILGGGKKLFPDDGTARPSLTGGQEHSPRVSFRVPRDVRKRPSKWPNAKARAYLNWRWKLLRNISSIDYRVTV